MEDLHLVVEHPNYEWNEKDTEQDEHEENHGRDVEDEEIGCFSAL